MIICLTSNAQKKTYLLGFTDINSLENTSLNINVSINILKERLQNINVTNLLIYFDKKLSNIVIKCENEIDTTQFTSLLKQRHKASIYECYNTKEFVDIIEKNNYNKLKTLFDEFKNIYSTTTSYDAGYIGIVASNNFKVANKIKIELQKYVDEKLKLCFLKST